MTEHRDARLLIVMGVSGSGKSTIASALAERLELPFFEGDAFHSVENVRKMAAGIALTDEDRGPWLDALSAAIAAEYLKGGIVVTCSALRRAYRDRLRRDVGRPLLFIHLSADRGTLASRVQGRIGHYMPISLLDSQLETLEVPGPDEADVMNAPPGDIDHTLRILLDALRCPAAGLP
jgi:gluconokinase